ncbi:MAG TPA: hypothetical protein VND21_08680 [Planctomycetota bacterium]|nr:hypothetical protein [Planctomycetota bacterium]
MRASRAASREFIVPITFTESVVSGSSTERTTPGTAAKWRR